MEWNFFNLKQKKDTFLHFQRIPFCNKNSLVPISHKNPDHYLIKKMIIRLLNDQIHPFFL